MSDLSSVIVHSRKQLSADSYSVAPATIEITNLRLRTYIGFNKEELEKQQDIIVNAEIKYKADEASETDHERTALNYKIICKQMIEYVEQGRFRLLEKLVASLLDIIMQETRVLSAKVRVDKPHALRFSDSVSVSLQAHRDNV